jgi:hypothetical protein
MLGRHIDDVIAKKQRELCGRLDQSLRIMGQGQIRAHQAERRALLRELEELERTGSRRRSCCPGRPPLTLRAMSSASGRRHNSRTLPFLSLRASWW